LTDGKIAIGLIRTSFGIKGELKVKSLSGEYEHFIVLKEIDLKVKDGRFLHYQVEYCKQQKDTLVMKLKGIDNPEVGKQLNGSEIWVERKFAAPLEEDEYYHADLCGCVVYLDNKQIGTVKAIAEGHAYELVEVLLSGGKTLIVPFTGEYIGAVDIENKQVFLTEEAKQL
jgi:16S rRNA processing protein RimM